MSPVLTYSLLRLAIFAVTLLVLYLLGARGLLLLALAVLVSGLVSFLALSRQRDAMSGVLVRRLERTRQRMQEAETREDAADEEARRRATGERAPSGDT